MAIRSSKVIFFGVSGKSAKDYILRYNHFGFISKGFLDIPTETTENRRFRSPHSYLTHPLRINFILPETGIPGLNLCCGQCRPIYIQIHVGGSEKNIGLQTQ